MFDFNAQHDCRLAKCEATGVRPVMQERVQSGVTETFIIHNTVIDRYLINLHALHNAHLVRATLPRDLTVPIPYAPDHITHRTTIAANLRSVQDAKRAKTAAKAAAKKAEVAAKKAELAAKGTSSRAAGKRRRVDDEESGPGEDETHDIDMVFIHEDGT